MTGFSGMRHHLVAASRESLCERSNASPSLGGATHSYPKFGIGSHFEAVVHVVVLTQCVRLSWRQYSSAVAAVVVASAMSAARGNGRCGGSGDW